MVADSRYTAHSTPVFPRRFCRLSLLHDGREELGVTQLGLFSSDAGSTCFVSGQNSCSTVHGTNSRSSYSRLKTRKSRTSGQQVSMLDVILGGAKQVNSTLRWYGQYTFGSSSPNTVSQRWSTCRACRPVWRQTGFSNAALLLHEAKDGRVDI